MVEEKATTAGKPAANAAAKGAATKKSKSLAYGKVQFKAFLWHGKWRFINKAEAEKSKKQKLAKLAKLKAEGKEVAPKVSDLFGICLSVNGYIAQVIVQDSQITVKC